MEAEQRQGAGRPALCRLPLAQRDGCGGVFHSALSGGGVLLRHPFPHEPGVRVRGQLPGCPSELVLPHRRQEHRYVFRHSGAPGCGAESGAGLDAGVPHSLQEPAAHLFPQPHDGAGGFGGTGLAGIVPLQRRGE